MHKRSFLCTLLLIFATTVSAQMPLRVRGTVTALDAHTLSVKTRDGSETRLAINDKTQFSLLSKLTLKDVKPGSFVGITAVGKGPGDALYAREVHVLPESRRGAGEGHYDWDLEPGASMTNGNIDASVDGNDGKTLTVSYKGGQQKIVVPPEAVIVSSEPADASVLHVGARVFVIVNDASNGAAPSARYIAVGKDGLKPPM